MSLVEILKSLVMTILSAMSTLYVWHIVLERKIEWRSKRFWFITVGLVAMISLNYYMMNNFVKVASITLILALACKQYTFDSIDDAFYIIIEYCNSHSILSIGL